MLALVKDASSVMLTVVSDNRCKELALFILNLPGADL